ncbi:DUF3048 domain-containing protein [Paenibacillus sp. 481]|uniref:DUF3048 domain-containing protein n=1 Tax=Paenibacillus sp. 481 TaxID=2835869 RepID=UPI001E452666|nr:DUF3048 domain-containing protein [Paenibacillus sp. 481]UHA74719.1 DUF3048 domain-containing protein [Paenibacillus sp. 481]
MRATRTWLTMIIAVATILLLLTSCSSDGDQAGKNASENGVDLPNGGEQRDVAPDHIGKPAPLTGVRSTDINSEHLHQKRPVAVMINNFKRARPQSGLSQADMLIEVMAEGGITRIVAIFHSQLHYDGPIGPVRSIRPYLIDIGESFNAVLAHAGGSPEAYSILKKERKAYLDEITNAGSYFWREKFRKAPHNLYTKLEQLEAGASKKKYRQDVDVPAFLFEENQDVAPQSVAVASLPQGAQAAHEVEVHFMKNDNPVKYVYEKEGRSYARYMDGKAHIDLVNNKPLTAANVMVIAAPHRVIDDVGRLEVQLQNGGEALLFKQGRVERGQWIRHEGDGPMVFIQDGKMVPMASGITHILVVPSQLSIEKYANWK